MPKTTEGFKAGDQVAYVPMHADGDLGHRDVEFGFVTSVNDQFVFCRFWAKHAGAGRFELRTRANSEACRPDDLAAWDSRPQSAVLEVLQRIQAGAGSYS